MKPIPQPYQDMRARGDFIPGLDFFFSSFLFFFFSQLFGFGHEQEKVLLSQLKICREIWCQAGAKETSCRIPQRWAVPADLQHLLAQAKVLPTCPRWIKIHLCVSVGHEPAPGRRFVSPATPWEQRCLPTCMGSAWKKHFPHGFSQGCCSSSCW